MNLTVRRCVKMRIVFFNPSRHMLFHRLFALAREGLCMKKFLINLFSIAGAFALLAFLFYGPPRLESMMDEDIYYGWLKGGDVEWTGMLKVWNLYNDTDRLNNEFLISQIKKYEKEHKGVYIEVTTLTKAQAQERLDSKIQPDLLLYPSAMEFVFERDISFEMPVPKANEAQQADFEFDVYLPEQSPEPEKNQAFGMSILSEEYEFAQQSRNFAYFIAAQATDMIK